MHETSSMKTVLVTGSEGQLGQELTTLANNHGQYQFTFIDRDELDLSDKEAIDVFFQDQHFDIIINCAAYTAVDKAEQEPDLADAINHLAIKQIAERAQRQNSKLIHISTDYVFDGTNHRPYTETDVTNPQAVYGLSKLKGELAVQQQMTDNAIIIRTSWVYSSFGSNFVKTMLGLGQTRDQLKVIFDQIGSPTYARDLAEAIMLIINHPEFTRESFQTTLYHYSNEGVSSWYDFAKIIFELSNTNCTVSPIEMKDYPTPAKRPHYSVLNKTKIKQAFNINIPYWQDSLKDCLKSLQEQN